MPPASVGMTVEAVRVRVLNFVMDVEPEYTSFALKKILWSPLYGQ